MQSFAQPSGRVKNMAKPMSITSHAAENSTISPNFTPRALLRWLRTAVEAHARYRVNSAVSPSQFQQADQEIQRCRRLMRTSR
jgi:hypothetical protein